ncbi:hypothetical protein TrRE_jg1209, partial [Triparma retinervis]
TQFVSVLSFKGELSTSFLSTLFDKLDNDGDGRIDGLEFMGGITLCCKGTFEEKAKFAFELYDFNLNAALSTTEICIMMQSTICGMLVLTGGSSSDEPAVSAFESLASAALSRADSDGSGQVTFDEFVGWARSNVEEDDILIASMKGFKDEMITTDRDEVWEAVNTSRWDLLESMEDEDSKERMERINKAPVHVWNSETLETEAVLSLHTRGVNLLAWGDDGSRLVSVGVDDSHIVALWDWRVNKMLASGIGGEGALLGAAVSEDGRTVVAVGAKQVLFFTVDGRALRSKKGLIGSQSGGVRQAFCSCAYLNNEAYVGCASGEIYRFRDRRLVAVFQAHGISEPVNTLERCKVSGGLISGGE